MATGFAELQHGEKSQPVQDRARDGLTKTSRCQQGHGQHGELSSQDSKTESESSEKAQTLDKTTEYGQDAQNSQLHDTDSVNTIEKSRDGCHHSLATCQSNKNTTISSKEGMVDSQHKCHEGDENQQELEETNETGRKELKLEERNRQSPYEQSDSETDILNPDIQKEAFQIPSTSYKAVFSLSTGDINYELLPVVTSEHRLKNPELSIFKSRTDVITSQIYNGGTDVTSAYAQGPQSHDYTCECVKSQSSEHRESSIKLYELLEAHKTLSKLAISAGNQDNEDKEEEKEKKKVDEGTDENEGAGMFKVHTIPRKTVSRITSHELVLAWPKLKYEIGRMIWGDEKFEPVPTVVDGAIDRYELGAVLLKTRLTNGEKIRLRRPHCQALGSIYDLIWHTDMPVDAAVEMAAPFRVEEGTPWPNHRFHGLAFKGGYCRQVAVTVHGCHRVAARPFPAPDNGLILNLYRFSGRYRTDKMYVITEVIYAEELHVTVRVSIRKEDVKILRRVPLAFRLHVYDVRDLTTLIRGRPYEKALRVRWMGLDDRNLPSSYPRKSRGMGDVTRRTSDITRRPAGGLPNRNARRGLGLDQGGDRQEQQQLQQPGPN